MANDFYEVTTDLDPYTLARSNVLDTEFAGIESGFAKLPSLSQLRSSNINYVAAGGTADAITVSAPTTWTTYTGKDGYRLTLKIGSNNTGAVTLNVDGLGVKACVRNSGAALAADDLEANGFYDFIYNSTTGKFHVKEAVGSFLTDVETQASAASASASAASGSASSASGSASSASTSASNASDSESLAAEWAEKTEDSAVTGYPGQYSALHHAAKAAASAAAAAAETVRTPEDELIFFGD